MDVEQAKEARRGAEPARTRNTPKKMDKASKQAAQIDRVRRRRVPSVDVRCGLCPERDTVALALQVR
jgi:hypothetical protein